jgi:hypothetical protein
MKETIKFDLLGEKRLDFDYFGVTYTTNHSYPIPLPGHLGVTIITNRPISYKSVRFVQRIMRRQRWALVMGVVFGLAVLYMIAKNLTDFGALVTDLILFFLFSALPLLIFFRGRSFLSLGSDREAFCIPMDRKKAKIRRAVELLQKTCTSPEIQWNVD